MVSEIWQTSWFGPPKYNSFNLVPQLFSPYHICPFGEPNWEVRPVTLTNGGTKMIGKVYWGTKLRELHLVDLIEKSVIL